MDERFVIEDYDLEDVQLQSGFGVYLNNAKKPMAFFARESWAIEWQRKMQAKTMAGTLFVRPTTLALDDHGRR